MSTTTDLALIDDFEDACALMTPLGRYILGNAAMPIRDAVLSSAARHRMYVVRYSEYSRWIAKETTNGDWYCLDPLISYASHASKRLPYIQVSRIWRDSTWRAQLVGDKLPLPNAGKRVSIVDDVAASGQTLSTILTAYAKHGIDVETILLCGATDHALSGLRRIAHEVSIRRFVERSLVCIHIRDACPFFPFSGRPSTDSESIRIGGRRLDVRIPTVALNLPGPWVRIFSDPYVIHAIAAARKEVAEQLSVHIKRPARVGDLLLLGERITLNLRPGQCGEYDTLLCSLD